MGTRRIKRPKRGKRTADVTPLRSRLSTEQVLRDIHRVMAGREFGSIDEANAFLATLVGPGLEHALAEAAPPSPREEAQNLACRAMEARTEREARSLVEQALAKDPDCVDALVVLAELNANSPEKAIVGMEKAIAAGERTLGAAFFAENKGHFWGLIETRPYMRARHQLADLLRGLGRTAEAMGHYEALLELNPNDNQGIRDTLLGCYLAVDDLDGARRLLKAYKGDISAVFAWGRVLERFLSGDLTAAARALKEARERNRFAELYLTARRKMPKSLPASYSLGSEEEAVFLLEQSATAWAAHPESLLWLNAQLAGIALPAEAYRVLKIQS